MMSDSKLRLVHEGWEAWRRGEFDTVEAMFEPAATWRWYEPGEWDCENRDDILRTLRERHEQGFGRTEVEVLEAGPDAVLLVSHPREIGGDEWPEETATVISFRGDKIIAMLDFRTRGEALAAVA